MSQRLRCGLIGAGRAGTSLARAMHLAGHRFDWIISRDASKAQALAMELGSAAFGGDSASCRSSADFIIIATPDKAIARIADKLAESNAAGVGSVCCHLSGAMDSDVLSPLRNVGASVMAFHPSQTLTGHDSEDVFRDVVFDMEGDDKACHTGMMIAEALGGSAMRFEPGGRIAVHLAATMASNLTVALTAMCRDIGTTSGIPADMSLRQLMPLLISTVENIRRNGVEDALTGPVSRGDADTVRRHCQTLRKLDLDAELTVYRVLSEKAVSIARDCGTIDAATGYEIIAMLKEYE